MSTSSASSVARAVGRARGEHREVMRRVRKTFQEETRRSTGAKQNLKETQTQKNLLGEEEREKTNFERRKANYRAHLERQAVIAEAKAARQIIRQESGRVLAERVVNQRRQTLQTLADASRTWITPETLDQHVEDFLNAVYGGVAPRQGSFLSPAGPSTQ